MEGRWCTTGLVWLTLVLGSVLCCLTGWTRYDRYLTCRYFFTTLPSAWDDVPIPYCLVFDFNNGTTHEGVAIKLVKRNNVEEQTITNYQLAEDASNCLVMVPSEAADRINTLCNLTAMAFHCTNREPTEDPDTPTTTPESTTRTTVQSTSTEANDVDYVTVTIVVTLSAVITVAIAVSLILMIKIRRRSVRRNNKNGDVAGLCENPTYGNETSTTGVNTGGADEPQDQALSGHSNTTYRDQCDSHIYAVIPEGNDGRSRLENEHTCVRNKDTSRGTESFALSETSSHYIKMSDMSAAARISENSFGYVTMEEARTKSEAATRNEASSSGEYVSVDDINRRMTPTRLRKLRDGASPDAHILTQSANPVRLDVDSKGYARLCE